jgi:biopolymer transport protein TolR
MSPPRKGVMPEINVTPLVDVVLVLLIIFMVTVPKMSDGPSVDLPEAKNPDAEIKIKVDPIEVHLTKDGAIHVDKEMLARDVALARLREHRNKDARRRLLLKADKSLPFGTVRKLFADCQQIGFAGASMQVSEIQK